MKKKYESELAGLAHQVGSRNAQLVRLALLGLREGRDAMTLQREIIAAGGEPRLTDSEVRRAITTAQQVFNGGTQPNRGTRDRRARPMVALPNDNLRSPNQREKNFVKKLITAGKGAKSGDLIAISNSSKERDVRKLAAEFLTHIFKPRELVFAGTLSTPRTRENLMTVEQLVEKIVTTTTALPTHIIPNPFTGEAGKNSAGKVSYCLDTTIAHKRMALIEFDRLKLEEQAAFWMGAIKTRLLPVRSLVYSGKKSIHGLIELKEDVDWAEQWRTLERLLCSDDDPDYCVDKACKNPSRFTRFPGAIRPGENKRQTLLYLSPTTSSASR